MGFVGIETPVPEPSIVYRNGLLDTQCRLPGATPSRQSGMRLLLPVILKVVGSQRHDRAI